MIQEHKPTIIGHFDLIKDKNKHSRYFREDEDWYKKEVEETLHEILLGGAILEVNTGGVSRNIIDSFYPSTWILRECRKLNIPIMINSNAHAITHLKANFNEALLMLMEAGYREQDVLIDLPSRVRHIV